MADGKGIREKAPPAAIDVGCLVGVTSGLVLVSSLLLRRPGILVVTLEAKLTNVLAVPRGWMSPRFT
jgi:hypothetical protein